MPSASGDPIDAAAAAAVAKNTARGASCSIAAAVVAAFVDPPDVEAPRTRALHARFARVVSGVGQSVSWTAPWLFATFPSPPLQTLSKAVCIEAGRVGEEEEVAVTMCTTMGVYIGNNSCFEAEFHNH